MVVGGAVGAGVVGGSVVGGSVVGAGVVGGSVGGASVVAAARVVGAANVLGAASVLETVDPAVAFVGAVPLDDVHAPSNKAPTTTTARRATTAGQRTENRF